MKAEELRIGNLVCADVVNEVGDKSSEIYQLTYHALGILLHGLEVSKSMIHPIPLTGEWLLKFGFYQDIEDDRYLEFKIKNDKWNRTLTVQKGEKEFMVSNRFDEWIICGECEFVHQLQNLYFALTGLEIEIQ